jgi:hypothetical protein
MTRVLVGMSVLAPVVVIEGAALLLVAKALVGTWVWGALAAAGFVLAYAVAVAFVARSARKHPDDAEAFNGAWGRAMAFGSGGWEPRKRDQDKRR